MIKVNTTKGVAYKKTSNKTDLSKVNTTPDRSKNQGGLLGGLGYVGGSIAAGVGGIGEGILDLGAAGIALLGGDKEYAKYLFKSNVVGDWHQSLTEDYNPGKVMQFIGDVGQGLGQSATMLIPYVGVPAFFLGVGSQGISGAAEKTGDVGFKEVAYGVTSGIVEGTLELALSAAGQGAKSIASAIAKRGGKGAAKTLFSTAVRRGLAGKILSSAAGEFLEEAASEVVDVGLQRLYRIDPNASTSLKDVLYAGIVGAVSGGIMGGSVNVVQTLNNRATGRKIVQDGNAQTLINTANLVADKLAGQGTNFRKAPEWVKTLRGEIDAYNKLVEKGEQSSAKGETILGEMQASLFFAETQAVASGLAYSIQQSSEENRATLAEYVNQTIPKDKRAREYTAEDIAKDTDGITMQLAILQFAGNEFINYADAISSLEADQAQEGAIGDVVGAMQEESAETVEAGQGEAMQGEAVQGAETPSTADAVPSVSTKLPPPQAVPLPLEGGIESTAQNQANAGIFDASAGVSTEGEVAKSDLASPLTDAKYSVATAKRAQKRIKENAARAERARQARLDQEGRMVEGTNQEQSAERKNEPSPSPSSDGATSPIERGEGEPKIRKPKEEILTDVQRAERAKERAKRLIEYEATVKVTSKELNTAREYIKDFDNLPKGARQAVIKMIRSADGKVDKKILAGVANLMTMRRKNGELVMPDLELRFAEGIVDGGLYTHIGEGENRRVLILINSDADFKDTIRGTIAHEVVHYIENRKGYRELADYVLKTAKKEKIAEIEKEYNEHYKGIYTAEAEKAGLTGEAITKKVAEKMATEDHKELIKSEVVAKLIGLRLNNEKFLQRYAQKDDAMIKKIFRYLRASVSYLKDKDNATADEVRELVLKFDEVIKGNVTSDGEEKTAFDASPKQIEEWEKPITLQDVQVLRSIGQKSINSFTPAEIQMAQKWAYKFYKEFGVKSPFFRAWFGEWRAHQTNEYVRVVGGANQNFKPGKSHNNDTNTDISWNRDLKGETINHLAREKASQYALEDVYSIIENAIYFDTAISMPTSKTKMPNTAFMHSFYSLYRTSDGGIHLLKVYIEEALSNNEQTVFKRGYQLKDIIKVADLPNSVLSSTGGLTEGTSTTMYSISDLYGFVKTFDKDFSPAPEVSKYALNEDGTPKVFYHGTNQGEFYEFLWDKTQRADGGFFGRGHYFTASRSMANLYGIRIVEAYLSFKNPFIWSEQIDTRDGNRGSNIIASNLIKRINMARAFPSLFANKKINAGVYNNNTGEYVDTSVEWSELESKIEEASNTLHLQKFADGTYQWFAPGRFWDESVGDRYSSVEEAESDKFSAASIAFSNKYQGVAQSMSFDDQSTYTQQYGDDITKLLISMKYDASMQNPEGDEVVIFESSKIKSATDNIGTFDKTNPNIKRDLAPKILSYNNTPSKRDIEYLDAVNRGDMETAQRMVDEAAKEAGYTVKAYHGTSHGGFNVFDTYGGNFGLFGMGSYFTENRDVADSYQNKGKGNQKQTYSVFLKSSKTLDMDATANISAWENAIPDAEGYFDNCKTNEDCFRALKEYCMDQEMIRWEAEDLITGLISQTMGYNAITHIGGGRWNNKDGTRHRVYIVFDPEQVKSADPVTYDDNGKVIPLSQRFNAKKTDIRYDLAPRKKKAKTVDKSKLNENGEVKDEFFAEAVGRMYQEETRRAQNTAEAYKEGNKVLNKKLETQKKLHEDLVAEIIELEDRVHHLENQNEAYKEGNKTVNELLSAARKRRNKAVIELEELRAELRQMGYDLEAEKRKVKRREDQIDKQKKMLKDAEREKARLEREFKLISEVEAREIARLKKQLAKERAEIGKAYSEAEIRREIKTMMERGLISKFFGGQYKPNLPMEKLNLIARYIAIELNTAGTAEGKRADALLEKAADEIVARLKFTDEDSGKKYVIRDLIDAETLEQFMDFAKTDIRDLFNNVGTINAYSELVRQYKLLEQKYNAENDKASEKAAWGKEFPKTYQAAMKVKALAEKNKGAGSDSIQFISKTLASVVDTAGHMNLTRVDEAAKAISDFLDGEIAKEEAERAQLSEGAELTSFSWDTYEMIRSLVNEFVQLREDRIGEQLTSEELRVFGEMLRGMKHVIERYNKEFVGSHLVNADTVVTTEITDLLSFAARNKEYKTKVGKFLGEKLGKTLNQLYFYNVLSPETVIEAVEGFKKNGLLKTLLHSIREGEQSSRTMAARMKDPFVQFMDNKENVWTDEKGRKHSFRNKLNDKMIKIKEKEISLGEAIYLYMLTKREHSHLGLKDNGYITYNDDGSVKETIYVLDPQMTRTEIESQLDEKDKAFLKMSEAFFNETASKIKYDADMKIFGFSNNQAGYYVPIIRDRYARMNGVSDPRMGISSIITVYNKSFTQALVRNNNALEGKSIMRIIDDHADGLADYSELYLPLKAFDRLYNRRVILDDGHAMSIRQVLNQKIWNGAEGYLTDLFKDVQGQSRGETSVVDAVAGWLRAGWVNSLLGANLKVVATQTTSLAAATQVIEGKYITAALSTITPGKDVSEIGDRADKYSKIIFARHFEMGALKSQGNIDKVTEIGKKTGALIEWMDRRVCLAIFHAAELKAEALGHGAVGTESNSIAAAKIADKAIFTTQAMNGSTERSALQRSKSEIAKMFSMFTSDTVKQLSHLYGNTMKYLAHKERAKTDSSYEALLANDKKEMLRSMRTLAIVGVMIGLITQGFKYLYGKEEEEPEDKVKDLAIDVVSSTLNILPVWSDVIDKVFLDYDMSINVIDVANDTLETVSNGFKLAGKITSGEYVSNKEIGRTSINIIKSVASLFGIPATPFERTVTGLLRRVAPSTIYGYDAMFKNPSYTADLQRAVENGNERLAEHILGQLYRNEVTGVYTSEELEIVADLYSKGYTSVIPQKIGESVNDVKLDKKQRQQFNKIYSQASAKVNEMIASAEFKELNDEQKAKAIKNLYSLYYNRAASTVAGKEVSNAQMYSWLTDNYSALFTSQAYKGGLDVVKDSKGKEVSVRDQFVEYAQNLGLSESDLLVMEFANGVRDKKTKAALIEHINTLTLSDEQKTVIAEKLSLEVKDGKLVEKKE